MVLPLLFPPLPMVPPLLPFHRFILSMRFPPHVTLTLLRSTLCARFHNRQAEEVPYEEPQLLKRLQVVGALAAHAD